MGLFRIMQLCTRFSNLGVGLTLFGFATLLSACSTTAYKEKADAEAYGLIGEKIDQVDGMTEAVSIEPADALDLGVLPVAEESHDFLGDAADSEIGAAIINLDAALETAFRHSRTYQNQKERLYIQALSLSIERHEFDPIFNGAVSGEHTWDASSDFDNSVSGLTRFGVSKLMKTGGAIAVNLSSNFFRFIHGDANESAFSALSGSIVQPLLRGAGRKVATENLIQAERDLLYQLRDFTRFRKEFTVQVATSYYNVLRSKDTIRNNFDGLKGVIQFLDRERAYEEEGLRTPGEVGELESNRLNRESGWTNSINRYQDNLDQFKILLGVSADSNVILDDRDLKALESEDLSLPDLSVPEAINIALVTRLDLETQVNLIEDAERRIHVATNGMKARLDLFTTADVPTKDGNRFTALDFNDAQYSFGFDLDIPFDRKSRRNNFRISLINLEAAHRSASLSIDNMKLNVRSAWRNLEQAHRDYAIDQLNVEINARRVEEEILLSELGLGEIRDSVNAQNALTLAQTSLTGSLVQQRVTLLEFWRDLGVLYINDNGQWEVPNDV